MKADYVKWGDAMKMIDLCRKEKNYRYTALLALGFFSGLRISDIKKLKYGDLKSRFKITEKKTKKNRSITMNQDVLNLLAECQNKLKKTDDDLIVEYCTFQTSRIIRAVCAKAHIWNLNLSNHTMRKSFAREIFEKNGGTELALIELSELLQHSSVKITRIYLGISEDDITRQYMSLKLKAV